MRAPTVRPALSRFVVRVFALALAASAVPATAAAQAAVPGDSEGSPSPEDDIPDAGAADRAEPGRASASGARKLEGSAAEPKAASAAGDPPSSVAVAPGAGRCREQPIHGGDHPEYKDHGCLRHALEWEGGFLYGGFEVDTTYARYEFPESDLYPYSTVYDIRGRFVMGPMFHYPLGSSGYFLRVTGTVVGWIRERDNIYQINVDDVYAQVGHEGTWDFQLGRFMTWRVYHKGLGYDLYTIEDTGAALDPNLSNNTYFPHTYEVDYIYLRNSPYVGGEIAGRAAFHYYPARFLGFELAGAYGRSDSGGSNTIGGRFAGDLHFKYVRASVGAEYRFQKPIQPLFAAAGTPAQLECPDCAVSDRKGVGGGLVVKYGPVEAGGGIAKGFDVVHVATASPDGGSVRDPASTGQRLSYGGYLEFDPGSLAFERSLILGVGVNQTELILENKDQFYHLQGAAYVAFPLGFNDAMLKFVVSRASGEYFDALNVDGSDFTLFERSMTAGRLRFSSAF